MISIYKASSTFEADIIKSVLEDNEIECFIQGYNHRSMLGFIGAYIQLDVLVDEADEAKALELINTIQWENMPSPEQAFEDSPAATIKVEKERESPAQLRNRFMRSFCFAFILPGAGCTSMGLKEAGSWIFIGTAICVFLIFTDMGPLSYISNAPGTFLLFKDFYYSPGFFILLALLLLMLTDMGLVLREFLRRKHAL